MCAIVSGEPVKTVTYDPAEGPGQGGRIERFCFMTFGSINVVLGLAGALVPLQAKLLATDAVMPSLAFLHGFYLQIELAKRALTALGLALTGFMLSRPHAARDTETVAAGIPAE